MASKVIQDLEIKAKPFLKWAGGKRWLVEQHAKEFPFFTGSYFEPFLGGGSVFFHLAPRNARLSDTNARLIECYRCIRDDYSNILRLMAKHQNQHSEEYYYHVRSQDFVSEEERAAQFLYLNRTCFNGLYRVNKKGRFNVPVGTKTKVIDEKESFPAISQALKGAHLDVCDFETSINSAGNGDFIFIDPPYTVKHDNNGFLKYNEHIFSWSDQVRLRDSVVRATERGAKILLTNAAHESVVELYRGVGHQSFVKRSSVLAGKSSARGHVHEMVVTVR